MSHVNEVIPPSPPASTKTEASTNGGWRKRAQELAKQTVEDEGNRVAALQSPFEHNTKDFHGTQHDALNAELRFKAESAHNKWAEVIELASNYLTPIAPMSESATTLLVKALENYRNGYHRTNHHEYSPFEIVEMHKLKVSLDDLEEAAKWPRPDEIAIQRAFRQLYQADALLPADTLNTSKETLSILDHFSKRPISDCSIAMHAQHHLDVTAALRDELQQGAEHLSAIDRRIAVSSSLRAEAFAAGDYQRCQDCFQEEVTLGSDLVKMNILRMGLFDDANDDADGFKRDVYDLITAASEMGSSFKARTAALGPALSDDVSVLRSAIMKAEADEASAAKSSEAAYAAQSAVVDDLNGQEIIVWKEIMDRVKILEKISADRNVAAQKCMRVVEEGASERERLRALQKALQAHMDRLKATLDAAHKIIAVDDLFQSYVADMTPLLQADCVEVDEALRELKIAEATSILIRYERLADTMEECSQRTKNRIDGLERAQRQRDLATETAVDTLDPRVARYEEERLRSDLQRAALEEYLYRLKETSSDIKSEVTPTLQFALAVLAQAEPTQKVLVGDVGLVEAGLIHRKESNSPKRNLAVARGDVRVSSIDLSRHPQLAAAVKALTLEDFQIGAATEYVANENAAVEGQRVQLQAAVRQLMDLKQQ